MAKFDGDPIPTDPRTGGGKGGREAAPELPIDEETPALVEGEEEKKGD